MSQAVLPNYIAEDDIQSLCSPILKKLGFNYFNFGRMYDDGSCFLVSTNQQVMNHLIKNEYPLYAPIERNQQKRKFFYLIPSNGPYNQVMQDVHTHFNIGSALDLFETNKGYVDICCFAAPPNNDEMMNVYLNNINLLENFTQQFKEKISNDLDHVKNKKIVLPEATQLNFKSHELVAPPLKLSTHGLTERQINCLANLAKGMTLKEIAKAMHLSPRTVEHHLEAVKNKLKCYSRSELVIKALKLSIIRDWL